MIEPITYFKFIYTPYDVKFPICRLELHIVAKSKDEAHEIALINGHKFFDQYLAIEVREEMRGYRKVEE